MEQRAANHIDLAKVLAAKGIKPRRWLVRLLNRLLHVDEMNECLDLYGHLEGVEFAQAIMDHLHITFDIRNIERIPKEGNPIVIANHPLGGPDGMALIAAIGS
ncbi:MAG: glycerol acyltransferase, partial [Bacteroidales bacterium]|nr:glycerol acyltransferase [Bacteroidales bacterium]